VRVGLCGLCALAFSGRNFIRCFALVFAVGRFLGLFGGLVNPCRAAGGPAMVFLRWFYLAKGAGGGR
jgi:hypothetical protein